MTKIFLAPRKFRVKPKEIWCQPQKNLDDKIYIIYIDDKGISNKSRSSEIFNKIDQDELPSSTEAISNLL